MRIILSTNQAIRLAQAIKPAIGTDPIRNHLTTVEISTTTDGARFTATDGYRMHQVTVAASDGWQIIDGETLNVTGKELVVNLALMAKTNGKDIGSVTLANVTEDNESIFNLTMRSTSQMVVVVDTVSREFPNCGAILATDPATSELVAQFEVSYLSDIVIAAGAVSKGRGRVGSPVRILNLNPSKPCHVTSANADMGMEFHGVIMPQRP